jgi:NAD+ diphosphatase
MLLSAPGFVPLIAPTASVEGEAWWFVFRGNTILVKRDPTRVEVPFVAHPEQLGLAPLSTQYLGTLHGRHCFSAECADDAAPPEDLHFAGLRSLFGAIDDATFLLAGRAVQIVDWDRSHRFCGRCGTPTERKEHERSRACPRCGQTHYPRLAPVAMALVRRGRELLLARSPHFPPDMMSALAGFVEPGESLEACLIREVHEEVGVVVNNLRYFSSQPWPFPHSLMVAFHCDYVSGDITPQADEIEAADWFTPEQLPVLPHRLSIARRLIEDALADLRGA